MLVQFPLPTMLSICTRLQHQGNTIISIHSDYHSLQSHSIAAQFTLHLLAPPPTFNYQPFSNYSRAFPLLHQGLDHVLLISLVSPITSYMSLTQLSPLFHYILSLIACIIQSLVSDMVCHSIYLQLVGEEVPQSFLLGSLFARYVCISCRQSPN